MAGAANGATFVLWLDCTSRCRALPVRCPARAYQVYSKSGGGGAVGVLVGSAKEALAKARELAESGGEVLIKDLSGKTIDAEAVAEVAARE